MGLGDAISRIIIDVKAETKSARTQLHELNGALEAMGKFVNFAREAMVEYADHTRLSLATTGLNMDKLSKSFQGLINEHDLLTFASRTSHGAFKLTQTEMEKVGQAAVALRNRGFDLHEAVDKLTNAMVKGKAEGLDDFGLSIANADTKAGRLKNIMGELDRVIKESGTTTADYADDVTRLANEWDNATAAFKRYTVEALKKIGTNDVFKLAYGEIARNDTGELGFVTREIERQQAIVSQKIAQSNLNKGVAIGRQNIRDRDKLDPEAAKKAAEEAKRKLEEARKIAIDLLDTQAAINATLRRDAAERAGIQSEIELIARLEQAADKQGLFRAEMKQLNDLVNAGKLSWDAYSVARAEAFQAHGQTDPAVDFATTKERLAEAASGIAEMQDELAAQQKAKKESFLESTFGKIEEFNAYASAFDMLSGATSSAMDAWITGSIGVGKAIKKAIGESLKSLAIQLSVEALKHGAYAIGSLAFGDVAGASAHGIAAAEFGVAAIAAGAAAKAMGSSGADSRDHRGASGGAAAGRRANGGDVSSPGSGNHGGGAGGPVREIHTFTYLDPFAGWNESQRKQYAQQMVNKAVSQSSARR